VLQGDYIWIEPVSGREFDVAIGARVISAEGRRIQVKDDDGKVSSKYEKGALQKRFSNLWVNSEMSIE
jgi:hypothetical protein